MQNITKLIDYKIIYITPEKLDKSEKVKQFLKFLDDSGILKRIIVDECHVVINWGDTFR